MDDFSGKTAVITGGASGVGRSIGKALAARGAHIVVADVDRAALDDTVTALHDAGTKVLGCVCDVTDPDNCSELANRAFDEFGAVHLVFANAGIGAGETGPIWEYSDKDWQWAFNVNVWGVVNMIKAFMPRLIDQGTEAHFVITGSGNGAFVIYPDQPIYSTTKAAVQAITEGLYYQVEAMDTPVRVHALFPGPHVVETGIFNSDRVRPAELAREGSKGDSGITSVDDMKRMMAEFGMELETTHPDEVAETALRGIVEDRFWILPLTETTEQKVRARFESILTRTDPVAPSVGG